MLSVLSRYHILQHPTLFLYLNHRPPTPVFKTNTMPFTKKQEQQGNLIFLREKSPLCFLVKVLQIHFVCWLLLKLRKQHPIKLLSSLTPNEAFLTSLVVAYAEALYLTHTDPHTCTLWRTQAYALKKRTLYIHILFICGIA